MSAPFVGGSSRRLLGRFFAPAAAAATAVLAKWPLHVPRLPHGTDTVFHLYTLVQLDALVEAGYLWSRWFPHQASGFGLPVFQYYPPRAPYVALAGQRLGASSVGAIRATPAAIPTLSDMGLTALIVLLAGLSPGRLRRRSSVGA